MQVEKYTHAIYGETGVTAISTLLAPTEETAGKMVESTGVGEGYDKYNDDIDGVPLDAAYLTPLERMVQGVGDSVAGVDEGYDDDIDGVPIDLGVYSIPGVGAPPLPPPHQY